MAQRRLQGPFDRVPAQQRFRSINLHWHDLRHEYASRLVERSVPLAQVRDLLGHASILTTERYDNQKLEALQAAAERLEGGKTFESEDGSHGQLVRRSGLARFREGGSFKNLSSSRRTALRWTRRSGRRKPQKSLTEHRLESWYRYGDSNPGPVAENHVS